MAAFNKIAFLSFGANLYGANSSMADLIEGLSRLGLKSLVILPELGPLCKRLEELGAETRVIPFHNGVHWNYLGDDILRSICSSTANRIRTLRKEFQNKRRMKRISSILLNWGADVLVSNTCVVTLGTSLSRVCNIPHIWHIREFGDLDWDFQPDHGFNQRRSQVKASDLVIFISNAVAQHHYEQIGLSAFKRSVILPNGIGSRKTLQARSRNHRSTGQTSFLIAGMIKPSKGQFDAVRALTRLRKNRLDAKLTVAGAGAVEDLRTFSESLGCQNWVEILGHVNDLDQIYASADCGLMCSANEGFGRVTAEYMSYGLPVIGRNSGATPELIDDRDTGLLYDGTVDDLATKMEWVCRHPEEAKQIGQKAKAKTVEQFCNETYSENFLNALRQIPRLAQ